MLGYTYRHLFIVLATILCIAGISWVALAHFIPSPPSEITILSSFPGSHYEQLAAHYKEIIERRFHLTVEVRVTRGAPDNLRILNDPNSDIQIGFLQGGLANREQAPDLLSLGRVDYQPFWLFHRAAEPLDDLTELKGKRIGVGPPGSGARIVTDKILGIGGITSENTTMLPFPVAGAYKALIEGRVDAVFHIMTSDEPVLLAMLKDPMIRPMSFAKEEAITRIFPTISRLVMPRGMVDYGKHIPATDITFLAETNFMAVRKEVHPAITDILVQTMLEAHRAPGLYQKAGEFPTQTDPEFPMAESAVDFYKNGPSFLNRYLPFWITNYLKRLAAVLTTVVAIAIPVFSFAPKTYRSLVEFRLNQMYRRLRAIDASLHKEIATADISLLETELASINRSIHLLGVPMQHLDLFFNIKSHLDLVRINLDLRRAELQSRMIKAA
jgi:TRAP-type uncharacterized transport system substrate-binding protein